MKIRFILVPLGAALLTGAVPVLAHHSFSAQYDATKPVEKKGTVSNENNQDLPYLVGPRQ